MLTIDDVRQAVRTIHGKVHRTPVLTCRALDDLAGASFFFKCENFQKVGAFKARGATKRRFFRSTMMTQARAWPPTPRATMPRPWPLRLASGEFQPMWSCPPVLPRSSGARWPATEPRSSTAPPTLAARESTLDSVVARTGAHFVHPYDNPLIIAGQGTAALELLEEVPDLDIIMAPVGGGRLAGRHRSGHCGAGAQRPDRGRRTGRG